MAASMPATSGLKQSKKDLEGSDEFDYNVNFGRGRSIRLPRVEQSHPQSYNMGKFSQFHLLLWKNYILQKRKKVVTCFEVGLPLLLSVILILIRRKVESSGVTVPTVFDAFQVNYLPEYLDPMQTAQQRSCPLVPEVMLYEPFRVEGLTAALCAHRPRSRFFPWRLYYTPKHNLTDQLMNNMADILGRDNVSDVYGFETEQIMVAQIIKEFEEECQGNFNCSTLGGVVFESSFTSDQKHLPANLTYKLRFSSSPRNKNFGVTSDLGVVSQESGWMTEFLFPSTPYIGPRSRNHTSGGAPGYFDEGFLGVQRAIDLSIIQMHNGSGALENVTMDVLLRRFPYPPYNDDVFVLVIQSQLPMVIMLSLIFYALMIVKDVVHEKERRLKESMKMMGLNNWLHWCAWFTKYLIFISVSMAIMTIFLCIPMTQYGSIISYSSWSLLLVFLLLYAIATINFSFMISTFFSKANSAAAAGGVLFFASYIPYFFLDPHYTTMTWSSKMGCCLISNVAMALGARVIGLFEGTGAGVQWSTIAKGVSVDDNFAMLHVLVMLMIDALIYAIITWYVEAVFPGEFGIPQPWYFPFTRSYWYGTVPQGDDVSAMLPQVDYMEDELINFEFMEKEPVDLRPGIRMQQLRKVFGKGERRKVAVAGTSLNMYEGQITALLGHNGAGKTTTMSMLTGFIPPTSGTAVVNGYDIKEDIQGVRNSLGLCPQHDVLFDTLTVEEHLVFFAKLKGMKGADVKEEVTRMLHATGLKDKNDAQSKTLSGGMKRKLSVGIALIAGSKVVILDEPTSGMDPNARRQTWDLLQQHREGRTMVLSTHFMDEADLLGDRIAIMAGGIIQCCGSSLFLKNKYGAGYHMGIVKNPNCDVRLLTDLVLSYVPSAQLESNISAELSFILPSESCDRFSALFREMESRKEEFGIDGYGASITTMEEVFMKVGEEVDSTLKEKLQQKIAITTGAKPADPLFNESLKKNTGLCLLTQQFYAMLKKRMLHTWRNWLVTLAQLLVPLLLTIASLSVIKTLPQPQDSPSLTLNLDRYGENTIAYASGVGDSQMPEADLVAQSFASQFHGQDSTVFLNNVTGYTLHPVVNDYLITKGEWDIATYNSEYMVAGTFNRSYRRDKSSTIQTIAHFNDASYHTPAIALNEMMNAILQTVTDQNHSIQTLNHPLPRTFKDQLEDVLDHKYEGYTVAITVIFSMSFLSSSFVLFLVKERSVRAKHVQFVSGVSSVTFWSATFFWDIVNYIFPAMSILIAIAAFNVQAYVTGNHLAFILLLLLQYAWAVLPFMYVLSFIFTIPSSGFVWITMFNILSGAATMLVVDILQITKLNLVYLSKILDWAFLAIFPNYCLGQGLSDFYSNFLTISVCESEEIQAFCNYNQSIISGCCKGKCGDSCYDYTDNYLSLERGGIGRMLIFLAVQGVVYWAVLALIESGLLRRLWYCITFNQTCKSSNILENSIHSFGPEDDDVAKERQRIMNTPMETLMTRDTLVLTELSKVYNSFTAVDSLSVGIPQGECFGLLGINGAGKTTTFKMLTGDERVSRGNAHLANFDIKSNMKEVQHRLGYCPQFDALIDQMTARETLRMFARLRGVYEEQIPGVVDSLLAALLLEEHADRLVCNFSGGNKRKLSTAVALVGDPPIIFLDEPTTGMDPVARRLLWDTLSRIRASGRTLVLTSHSMEECEALCTRIAIMVNGQFKCLGSTQHLKYKFGEGYTLIVKVAYPTDGNQPDVLPLMEYIEQTFPHSILKDIHQGMMHYHITRRSISWADIFDTMERVKYRFHIEDYSVSQTTLEQVFMNFARAQVTPQEDSRKLCPRLRTCFAEYCCRCCLSEESDEEDLIHVLDHDNPSV